MSNSLKTYGERLKYFQEFVSPNNKSKFAREIGVTPSTLSSTYNTDNPNTETVKRITKSYPQLNLNWLLRGTGEMIISDYSDNHIIKYYDTTTASMGNTQFLDNSDEHFEEIMIPNFKDCQYAINAEGNSMYPLIKSGNIILLKEWKESFIEWGNIYLVVTKNGYRAVKMVYPSTDENKIECRSENSNEFPPFSINKNDIYKMYQVKGWVCRNSF